MFDFWTLGFLMFCKTFELLDFLTSGRVGFGTFRVSDFPFVDFFVLFDLWIFLFCYFSTVGLCDFGTLGHLDFWTWHFLTTQNAKSNF